MADILTRTAVDTVEKLENFSPATRDHLILIRDACQALRSGAASEIDLTVQTKDWTLTVRAKRG